MVKITNFERLVEFVDYLKSNAIEYKALISKTSHKPRIEPGNHLDVLMFTLFTAIGHFCFTEECSIEDPVMRQHYNQLKELTNASDGNIQIKTVLALWE